MRSEQDELEVVVSTQNYDIIGISKTWNVSHHCSAAMQGYGLFWRDRHGG